MRLFVGLDIGENVSGAIESFIQKFRDLAPAARWVPSESLHITLKFIGHSHDITEVTDALSGLRLPAFQLVFQGTGFFPNSSRPRIFWIGVESNKILLSVATTINERLAAIRVPSEIGAFHPHVTIARIPSKSRHSLNAGSKNSGLEVLRDKTALLPSPQFGTITAREFYVYSSQSTAEGSRYTKLGRFPLAD